VNDPLTLVVRSEPLDASQTDAYHRWYARHRFECIDGDPRYMALYTIADFSIFSTPAYRQIQGFGPMTDHVRFTRNVYRTMPNGGPP
jgi:hypothetical protein